MLVNAGKPAGAVDIYRKEIASYQSMLDNAERLTLSGDLRRHVLRYQIRALLRMSVIETALGRHTDALASSAEAKRLIDPLADEDMETFGEQVALVNTNYAEIRLQANQDLPAALDAMIVAAAILRQPTATSRQAYLPNVLRVTDSIMRRLGRDPTKLEGLLAAAGKGHPQLSMPAGVAPLNVIQRVEVRGLGTQFGFGKKIIGVTPRDQQGLHFGTLWAFAFGLPWRPSLRLSFAYGPTTSEMIGSRITTWTEHRIIGVAPLNRREIVKTLLYRWLLGPAVIIVPIVLFFSDVDALVHDFGILALAFPIGWLLGVGTLIDRLHKKYVNGDLRRPT